MPFLALALTAALTPVTIPSKILGETRRVIVHVPSSFEKTTRKYPLAVVLDGVSLLEPVVTASEALTKGGQMPEMVIVAIENTNRLRDLTPPGISVSGSSLNEGGDRFLDFIEKELIPAVDAQFRTTAPRMLIGHSSGAILATYAAATRDAFPVVLALDLPAHLEDGWMEKQLRARAAARQTPLHYASYEARFGWRDDAWARIVAFAPKSWSLHRERLVHETHNTMTFAGSYLGLRELFAGYSIVSAPVAPTTSILPSYEKLTAQFGAPLIPPRALMQRVVEDLLIEGRGAGAEAAFDQMVADYGEPADAAKLKARIAEVSKRPPPSETVESLLATPFATPAEASAFIGEWEGQMWINPVSKNRFVVRIVSDGSKLSGTSVSFPAPNEEMSQPLEYLRVTSRGLTFGVMNGMRPRGLLMYEGTMKDGVLSGVMRFGGVTLTPLEGEEIPVIHFSMKKVATASPRP